MGKTEKPSPVKLVTGIISSSQELFEKCEKPLVRHFGEIDYKSKSMDFNFTDYYSKDMGMGLSRRFWSFKNLIDPSRLGLVKIFTNTLEARFARASKVSKRPINIDPGYITDAKLVLASTKDYSHRIYLGKNIYAEITLFYQKNTFHPNKWTYPDYRTDEYIAVFNDIRAIFMKHRRH
jgi:hypothetical protein